MSRSARRLSRNWAMTIAIATIAWTMAGAACAKRPILHKGISPAWASAPTPPSSLLYIPPAIQAPTTLPAPTTTLPDVGLLPQTHQFPSATDPAWLTRISALGNAIVDGQPDEALTCFFPRTAYLQVKTVRDPAADWTNRLLGEYDADIAALHRALGPGKASFAGVTIPPAAAWIPPGREFNKIGYYRVYNTRLRFTVNGQPRTFAIASLISWRGQWYVVHLQRLT